MSLGRSLALTLFGLVTAVAPIRVARADFVLSLGEDIISPGAASMLVDALYPAVARTPAGDAIAAQIPGQVQQAVLALQSTLQPALSQLRIAPLAAHTATAGVAAARNSPVDHASNIEVGSLTLSVSVAAQGLHHLLAPGIALEPGQLPPVGAAPGGALTLGFRLGALGVPAGGAFDASLLQIYVSAMHIGLVTPGEEFSASASNFGLHAKYPLVAPRYLTHYKLVRWGGLNVATGVTYAQTRMGLHVHLPAGTAQRDVALEGRPVRLRATWEGDARLDMRLHVITWPIEVASSIQVLRMLTLFGGVAVDFNWGGMAVDFDASAPIKVYGTAPGQAKEVLLASPTPSVALHVARPPMHVDGRAFVGAQVNIGLAALFVQAAADTTRTFAATAGLRLFY